MNSWSNRLLFALLVLFMWFSFCYWVKPLLMSCDSDLRIAAAVGQIGHHLAILVLCPVVLDLSAVLARGMFGFLLKEGKYMMLFCDPSLIITHS